MTDVFDRIAGRAAVSPGPPSRAGSVRLRRPLSFADVAVSPDPPPSRGAEESRTWPAAEEGRPATWPATPEQRPHEDEHEDEDEGGPAPATRHGTPPAARRGRGAMPVADDPDPRSPDPVEAPPSDVPAARPAPALVTPSGAPPHDGGSPPVPAPPVDPAPGGPPPSVGAAVAAASAAAARPAVEVPSRPPEAPRPPAGVVPPPSTRSHDAPPAAVRRPDTRSSGTGPDQSPTPRPARRRRVETAAPPGRPLDPEELLRDHVAPALVARGTLTSDEAARLVPGTSELPQVPSGEVHVHIDRVEVRRPWPAPAPISGAAEPRPVDHADYLARQRRRWS
ncbi:hypothetical protein [Isoptericola sp. b408]|uniref:hypothetical protein n=1 Tax=Isoptericola sp. b408 TaxID=3064653 RepID=UPI002712E326|nr:hypothetical protein [Isoptericola sp. b408]MDO8152627.1 hypothetical protein [Isoptericola sp. b408]